MREAHHQSPRATERPRTASECGAVLGAPPTKPVPVGPRSPIKFAGQTGSANSLPATKRWTPKTKEEEALAWLSPA